MYDIVNYEEAGTVQEAIRLLQANPRARLIAGGSDLLVKIYKGKITDAELVSLRGIIALKDISIEGDGTVRIGACATFSRIAGHPLIRKHVPVLAEAVSRVGGPQIRNIGTIGGNICNGVTSSDSAPTLFALNALLRLEGADGTRVGPIQDFYLGPGKVDLRQAEVLTEILLTKENYQGFGGHYIKFAMREAMDIATLSCAAVCKIVGQNVIADFRLALGVAAPTPMRCLRAEEIARGRVFSEELLLETGRTAVTEVNPRTSWRATREYRLQLVEELSKRAFKQAFVKAGGVLL